MGCLLVLALLQQPDADIRALIENLGSEKIEVREAATGKLKKLGDAAKPALEEAAKSGDGERATLARSLLRFFEVRAKLSPGLLKAIPDAADRLATSDKAWAEVLLEAAATKDNESLFPFLTRRDLDVLAAPAVEGASDTKQRLDVIRIIGVWNLKSGLAALEQRLQDPEESIRSGVLSSLRSVSFEITPKIAAALKDESVRVRMQIMGMLGERRERRYAADVRDILDKGPPELRGAAMMSLINIEGAAAAKADVLRHLDSLPDESAAQILVALADPELAPKAFKMVNGKDHYVRRVALNALCRMKARQYLEDILPLLDDGDISTRVVAAAAVARLGKPEHGAKMLFLLKEGDYSTRRGGVSILRVLDAPEYAKDIQPLLADPNHWVRVEAAVALNSLEVAKADDVLPLSDPKDARFCAKNAEVAMAAADMAMRTPRADQDRVARAFETREKDASIDVSTIASMALVRMGRKSRADQLELVDRMRASPIYLRHAGSLCDALAIANEPRLRRRIDMKVPVESGEDLNAVLKPTGLSVESEWPRLENTRAGRSLTGYEIIRRHSILNMVVEKGVIRFSMSAWQALDRWSEILK